MGRRTITLRGDAAKAFVESHLGLAPMSEEDALRRIATRVHMEVSAGNMTGAVALLTILTKSGPLKAAEAISG
jgi:hypothetical protein